MAARVLLSENGSLDCVTATSVACTVLVDTIPSKITRVNEQLSKTNAASTYVIAIDTLRPYINCIRY